MAIAAFTAIESQLSRCSGPFPDLTFCQTRQWQHICKAGEKQKQQQLKQHGREGKLEESSPSLTDCVKDCPT